MYFLRFSLATCGASSAVLVRVVTHSAFSVLVL